VKFASVLVLLALSLGAEAAEPKRVLITSGRSSNFSSAATVRRGRTW